MNTLEGVRSTRNLGSGPQKVGVRLVRNCHSSITCESCEALSFGWVMSQAIVSGLENLLGTRSPVLHFPRRISLYSLCRPPNSFTILQPTEYRGLFLQMKKPSIMPCPRPCYHYVAHLFLPLGSRKVVAHCLLLS